MRVVAIADTHLPRGSRVLPRECVALLRRSDAILHAGDLTSAAFLEEMQSYGPPVHAIHGNADEALLRELLPSELVVPVGEAQLALVHDAGPRAGREDRLIRRFPDCDGVLYGHTHLPQAELVAGTWILNPGSPTERRRAPSRSMLSLEIAPGRKIRPELVFLA
jgi:putative phosphoesterase